MATTKGTTKRWLSSAIALVIAMPLVAFASSPTSRSLAWELVGPIFEGSIWTIESVEPKHLSGHFDTERVTDFGNNYTHYALTVDRIDELDGFTIRNTNERLGSLTNIFKIEDGAAYSRHDNTEAWDRIVPGEDYAGTQAIAVPIDYIPRKGGGTSTHWQAIGEFNGEQVEVTGRRTDIAVTFQGALILWLLLAGAVIFWALAIVRSRKELGERRRGLLFFGGGILIIAIAIAGFIAPNTEGPDPAPPPDSFSRNTAQNEENVLSEATNGLGETLKLVDTKHRYKQCSAVITDDSGAVVLEEPMPSCSELSNVVASEDAFYVFDHAGGFNRPRKPIYRIASDGISEAVNISIGRDYCHRHGRFLAYDEESNMLWLTYLAWTEIKSTDTKQCRITAAGFSSDVVRSQLQRVGAPLTLKTFTRVGGEGTQASLSDVRIQDSGVLAVEWRGTVYQDDMRSEEEWLEAFSLETGELLVSQKQNPQTNLTHSTFRIPFGASRILYPPSARDYEQALYIAHELPKFDSPETLDGHLQVMRRPAYERDEVEELYSGEIVGDEQITNTEGTPLRIVRGVFTSNPFNNLEGFSFIAAISENHLGHLYVISAYGQEDLSEELLADFYIITDSFRLRELRPNRYVPPPM